MAGYQVGTLRAKIVPDARGFHTNLKQQLAKNKEAAKIRVIPDSDQFRSDLIVALEKATKGIAVGVEVKPDTRKFVNGVGKARKAASKPVKVPVDADTKEAERKVDGVTGSATLQVFAYMRDKGARATLKELVRGRRAEINPEVEGEAKAEGILDLIARTRVARFSARVDTAVAPILKEMGVSALSASTSFARLNVMAGGVLAAIGGIAPVAAVATSNLYQLGASAGSVAGYMAAPALTGAALTVGALAVAVNGLGDAWSAMAEGGEAYTEALASLSASAAATVVALEPLRASLSGIAYRVQEAFFAPIAPQIAALTAVVPPLSIALEAVAGALGSMVANLSAFLSQGIGLAAFSSLVTNSAIAFQPLIGALGSVLQGIVVIGGAAAPVFAELTAGANQSAGAWLASLQSMYASGELTATVRDRVAGLSAAWGQTRAVMASVGGIISGVFTAARNAAGGAGGAIASALESMNQFVNSVGGQESLTSFFASMQAAVGALLPVLQQWGGILGGVVAPILAEFVTTLAPMLTPVLDAWRAAFQAIQPYVPQLADALGSILQAVAPLLPIFMELLMVALQPLMELLPIITFAIKAVAAVLQFLMPVLKVAVYIFMSFYTPIGLVSKAIRALRFVFTALGPAFKTTVTVIKVVLQGMWAAVKAIFGAIGRIAGGLWTRLVNVFRAGGQRIAGVFRSAWEGIRNFFSGAIDWLLAPGRDLMQGLLNGIKAMAGKVTETVRNIGSKIKNGFKSLMGIHSPSRVFAEYGQNISMGLVQGIDGSLGRVDEATGRLASHASPVAPAAVNLPDTGVEPTAGMAKDMAALGSAVSATVGQTISPALSTLGQGYAAARAASMQAATGVSQSTGVMGSAIAGTVFGQVNPALGAARASMFQTAQTTQSAALGVIAPVWGQAGARIRATQSGPIETAFRETRNSVNYTASTFGPAASLIAAQWDRVRPATANPVRYAIGTVFNGGLVGMWNSVSELLGTKKMGVYPLRFATGGFVRGPGGPTDDEIPAMLSNGEFVMRAAAVDKIGVHNLNALNSGRVSVAPTAYKQDLTSLMATDATFRSMAAHYAAGGVVEGSTAWRQLKRGWDWARKLSGRPYVLGGDPVGGGGTDCSGYMSSIADRIQGGAGHRQWATMAFNGGTNQQRATGPQGFVKGLAAGFSIGVTNGGPAGGHTAGTIGGVPGMPATNVESGGSPSRVKFGPGAAGADDSYLRTHYHLPIIDGRFISGGGASGPSMEELVAQAMAPFKRKVKTAVAAYRGTGGRIDAVPGAVADKLQKAITVKVDKLAEDLGGGPIPGGSGAERWRPMIRRAYARQRYQWTKAKEDAWVRQIHTESGGNPNIAQQIVDVNGTGESAGVGLGQMIPSTWAAFRDPALPDNRRDPWAMINAMVRYGERKYGARLLSVIGHGHGYDMGGWLDPGTNHVYNGFKKPEAVLTPAESEAFVGIARMYAEDSRAGATYVGQRVETQIVADPDEITARTRRGVRRALREEAVRV